MSKVKKEIVEAGIIQLIGKITDSMPSTAHKFALGGASALVTMKGSQYIQNMLGFVSDQEGMVELEQIKSIMDSAFKASDNKLSLELFTPQTVGIMSMFVKPVTVTITKQDIDDIMAQIQANSIPEVQIQQS